MSFSGAAAVSRLGALRLAFFRVETQPSHQRPTIFRCIRRTRPRVALRTCNFVEEKSELRFDIMRAIAVRFANYLYRRRAGVSLQSRTFSSGKEELTVEEEAERKIGWLLKLMFAGTASAVAYQFFPYMGDNLMQQSVSLLQVKDPLFKRMGASRLTRFAVDDERRMKIVEMGGAQGLLNMLNTASDDRTREAALKALEALSQSDEVLASLYHAGAITIIRSIPNSLEGADVERFKLSLMKRFQDQRYDGSS